MPRRYSRTFLNRAVALYAVALAAGGCGGASEEAQLEREQLVQQRVEAERRDAARQARQDERIKQLEQKLRERGKDAPKESAVPNPPATPARATPPPTPAQANPSVGSGGDWPGGSGYAVVLASKTSETEARATQRRASNAGLDAGILVSSEFSSLRPGYWVVFSGSYSSQQQAAERQARARTLGFGDAYVRFVAP